MLCKPTQRKYESAVSVNLGRNIDAVVVDEEKTAIECIEVGFMHLCILMSTHPIFKYPCTQRARQAMFLPLDTISVKPINDKCHFFTKGARLAVDVIQYEPAVERAMYHICGTSFPPHHTCTMDNGDPYLTCYRSWKISRTCSPLCSLLMSPHWLLAESTWILTSGLLIMSLHMVSSSFA